MMVPATHLPHTVRPALASLRWAGLCGLLVLELILLTLRFDAETLRGSGIVSVLFLQVHHLQHVALATAAALVLLAGPRVKRELQISSLAFRGVPWVWAHLTAILAFTQLTAVLLEWPLPQTVRWAVAACWLLVGLLAFVAWALALLSARTWKRLLNDCSGPAVVSLGVGLAAWALGLAANWLWLPLRESTFALVHALLVLACPDVVCDEGAAVIGTPRFHAQISPECSGYEGMGLVVAFLGVYLWLFRGRLRFPQALLLLPVGILAVYLLNAVRIAALVLIGTHLSPEVAAGGFHSQAGWIAFNAVALGLAVLSRRLPFFSSDSGVSLTDPNHNPTLAYLAPLLAILATAMLTGALSSGFDWLYPVKVIVALPVLGWFAGCYRDLRWSFSWTAGLIGTGVYALWLLLEPARTIDPAETSLARGLASMPSSLAVAWLIFRVLGSVLTVPLAEELAFRGYLLRRLQSADFEKVPLTRFSWLAFLVSSVLFGALHGRWLAGTLAGMAYALAAHRRGRLSDAVVAHATTNGLLAVQVLTTGDWRLWL